ncbi:helix-turn-helix domain-containing protein [Gorillibacterium massiliense]|uniref:helix-turn-helix domain-containing protein n=1 Tax=Gorillibacterium massiliense TaxID=1280390 RepID=UPI0004B54F0C|nr:helix-turn-helix transcriptional regulator [Gorillibacterium massiliense]
MDRIGISHRVRAFRKLKGLTQTDLADKMGVSVSVIGAVERAARKPDAALIRRIAEVLHVGEEEILLSSRQERRMEC